MYQYILFDLDGTLTDPKTGICRSVSRQQLFEQVFSLNDEVSPESIELYIHRLRKKLQGSDVRIATLRGLGYVLERNDEVG